MCCCILCKLLASLFLFVCRPLHARSSKRSAGEHLDVRLLLILSSAPFFSAHPALSPLSTPLFIPPSVTGQTDEEKCQPPDERERGSEVERQGERPVEWETTLSVRSTRRITFTWLHSFTCNPSLFCSIPSTFFSSHIHVSFCHSVSSESGQNAFSLFHFHLLPSSSFGLIHLLLIESCASTFPLITAFLLRFLYFRHLCLFSHHPLHSSSLRARPLLFPHPSESGEELKGQRWTCCMCGHCCSTLTHTHTYVHGSPWSCQQSLSWLWPVTHTHTLKNTHAHVAAVPAWPQFLGMWW